MMVKPSSSSSSSSSPPASPRTACPSVGASTESSTITSNNDDATTSRSVAPPPTSTKTSPTSTTGSTTTTASSRTRRQSPPLPEPVAQAIRDMTWPLDVPLQSLKLESIETLAQERGCHPILGKVVNTVALLRDQATAAATAAAAADKSSKHNPDEDYYWARIATACILLGYGYTDEAHNLIGPLCFPKALPFYHGPPIAAKPEILAAASYCHALVHRQEGPHASEYGMKGFGNAHFWAGSTLRCGGEETLPLLQVKQAILQLARTSHTTHSPAEATAWVQSALDQTFGCEWDPRPLTELCATVWNTMHREGDGGGVSSSTRHVLHTFCERAALVELQILLQHALEQLGYDTSCVQMTVRNILHPRHEHDNDDDNNNNNIVRALPHTLEQALQIQNHAIVVTTAKAPFKILHVNQAWVDLCGFTAEQAHHQTFDSLQIQRPPDSNTAEAAIMVRQCLGTLRPQQATLINYTRRGQRFVNHVAIRPIMKTTMTTTNDDDNNGAKVEYLVGILQKVDNSVA